MDSREDKIKTRLIDWGLSTEYKPFNDEPFPKEWRNRPIQYNVPFSSIIFTEVFIQKYNKFIQKGGKQTEQELKPFVLDYIYVWFKKRGLGHYKLINKIMYILFNKELPNVNETTKQKIIENEFTINYILNYITEILIHFTKFRENGNLNLREYLDNVFIHIIDIWGCITIYVPILIIFYNNYDKLNEEQLEIFKLLKHILITYLYSPRIEPVNINNLVDDLNKLDKLLHLANDINNDTSNYKIKSSSKQISYNKTSKLIFKQSKSKSKTQKIKSFLFISQQLKKTHKN